MRKYEHIEVMIAVPVTTPARTKAHGRGTNAQFRQCIPDDVIEFKARAGLSLGNCSLNKALAFCTSFTRIAFEMVQSDKYCGGPSAEKHGLLAISCKLGHVDIIGSGLNLGSGPELLEIYIRRHIYQYHQPSVVETAIEGGFVCSRLLVISDDF